jgi:hypothetical protein
MSKKKPTPKDSNKFLKTRNRDRAIDARTLGVNIEGVSFFKFSEKMNKLNEDAQIRQYTPQALGRKRNMFLNTLALDENKFREWVQNRLYRIAYDNKRSISDFTPKDIEIGLNKWEGILRNGDPGFGKYQSQFSTYKQRFIKTAAQILANAPSGRGSRGTEPHEAPPLDPNGQSMTPTALKSQGGSVDPEAGASMAVGGSGVDPQMQVTPEEDTVAAMIADMQKALSMKEKQFVNHVEDKLLNNDLDPSSVNAAELEKSLDDDFQNLLDAIPADSTINEQEAEIEEIYGQYKERFLQTASKMVAKTGKKIENANKKQAVKAKSIGAKAADYEAALSLGMTTFTGQDLESTGMDESHVDLMRKNPELYAAGKRMANTIISMHPLLKDAGVRWMGKETSTDEVHSNWEGTDGTSKTDVMFDLGDKRVKFKNGKFVACGKKDKDENCSSKIKMSMKLGDSQFASGGDKETMSTFNRTLENLKGKDFDLSDPRKLSHRLIADGMDPQEAKEKAQAIVEKTQMLRQGFETLTTFHTYKGTVSDYQKGGVYSAKTEKEFKQTKKLVDAADKFAKEVSTHVAEMANLFPSFASEFVYVTMTGDGKFKEGSDRQANYIISTDHAGDKVIILPASRDLASRIASEIQIVAKAKSSSVKSKKDPLVEKYMAKGMTKEEADRKASLESPYRVWQVVRVLASSRAQKVLSDPATAAQVLQNSRLLDFVNAMSFLKEQEEEIPEEEMSDEEMPMEEDTLDPDTRDYVDAAIDYAFSSFQNMIKFFGVEFNGVSSNDYNIYNMFAADQPIDLKDQINNRVDVNNQIGDEINQMTLQKESNDFFAIRKKMKETYNL